MQDQAILVSQEIVFSLCPRLSLSLSLHIFTFFAPIQFKLPSTDASFKKLIHKGLEVKGSILLLRKRLSLWFATWRRLNLVIFFNISRYELIGRYMVQAGNACDWSFLLSNGCIAKRTQEPH